MYAVLRSTDARLSMPHVTPKTVQIATGISSLDAILGSGIPLGSLVLIEEDEYGLYSRILTKCFLSEGIICHDSLFLASKDENPESVMKDLPQLSSNKNENRVTSSTEELQIAWRYKNNQQLLSEPISKNNSFISHDFDFSCKIPVNNIEDAEIKVWPKNSHAVIDDSGLIDEIIKFISACKSVKGSMNSRKIMRVVVQSLGSPIWKIECKSIYQILFKLRSIVHNSNLVALVTIPSKLLGPLIIDRCMQISDIVISMKSLMNTKDPSLKDFSGLIKFSKISALNSFSIYVPEDIDWAFKIVKKRLIIQKLHLPPESNSTGQREQDDLALISMPYCRLNF